MGNRTNLDDVATIVVWLRGQPFYREVSPPEDDEVCVTLQSIAITPSDPTVLINQSQQLVATGTWSDGTTLNITSAVTWAVANGLIGIISNGTDGGLLSTIGTGSTTVTATVFGVTGSITLTVPAQRDFRSTSSQGYFAPGMAPARVTAVPIPVPDDLGATCYLSFSNQSAAYPNTAHGATLANMGFWLYDGISGPSGIVKPTGTYFAAYTAQTVPGAGGTLLMGPFSASGHGGGGFLCALVGSPTGSEFNVALNITEGGYQDGTSDGSSIPGSLSYLANPIGTLRLTGFKTARTRVVCMGDSLANGYSPANEVRREQSMFVRLGLDNTWSVDVLGISGMTLAQATSLAFYAEGVVADSAAVLVTNLSINSLPTWANLAAAQADYAAFIAAAQARGFTKIILCTLTPSDAYPDGTYGTLRNAVNAWMLTQEGVGGVTKVVDLDAALRDPGDYTKLLAANRLSDNTHYSVVGHQVASAAIAVKVAAAA